MGVDKCQPPMIKYYPTQKRGKNDNQQQVVSGWRFIHHPKVKKDGRD
jgi:hypothetical protein